MKHWAWLVIAFAMGAGLAACSAGNPVENSPEMPAAPEGPALIMFYTDN